MNRVEANPTWGSSDVLALLTNGLAAAEAIVLYLLTARYLHVVLDPGLHRVVWDTGK